MNHEKAGNFQRVQELFTVIDSDTVPVVVDGPLAQRIRQGKTNWRELQKYSVSISRNKLTQWSARAITDHIYQWTLPYDSFLGYMRGVLHLSGPSPTGRVD